MHLGLSLVKVKIRENALRETFESSINLDILNCSYVVILFERERLYTYSVRAGVSALGRDKGTGYG